MLMENEKNVLIEKEAKLPEPSQWLPLPHLPVCRRHQLRRKTQEWQLLLDARGIPCHRVYSLYRWSLHVPEPFHPLAMDEIRKSEKENAAWPPAAPTYLHYRNQWITLGILTLLALFHIVTQSTEIPWKELGSAHSLLISKGEWWRTITALTLHTDTVHLAGNLALGGILASRHCKETGSAIGWLSILLTAALANYINAELHNPMHRAIGASTAVFAVLGLIAGRRILKPYSKKMKLVPVAAAIGLLGLLGTSGENTDIGAHLWGFICGLAGGLVLLDHWIEKINRSVWHAVLAVTALTLPLLAWFLAFSAHS